MGKSYHFNLEATPTVTFALKGKKKKNERLTSLSGRVLYPTVQVWHSGASRVKPRCSEASVEDYRIQRALETPAAPSLLATTVSLRSDAVKTIPDWSGLS